MENLAVEPDIQWLYNGTTVGGTNITVGAVMMTGDMFTQNLRFSPLRSSHGGQYICRASVHIWAIFLQGISSQSSLNITIKSKNIMAYGSTPYVGMAPKKNGGHVKSALSRSIWTPVVIGPPVQILQ